jgi:predicted Zn finger-like uncharacterized protein
MFTVCPKCALTLVVTAADLRVAQGYVRCGRCSSVFNALARLADDRSAGAADAAAATDAPAASVAEDDIEAGDGLEAVAEADPGDAAVEAEPQPAPAAAQPGAAEPAAEEEPLAEDSLEFDPTRTDAASVFVEPPPDPQWTAATGSFKAMVAANPEKDEDVEVEIDSAFLASMLKADTAPPPAPRPGAAAQRPASAPPAPPPAPPSPAAAPGPAPAAAAPQSTPAAAAASREVPPPASAAPPVRTRAMPRHATPHSRPSYEAAAPAPPAAEAVRATDLRTGLTRASAEADDEESTAELPARLRLAKLAWPAGVAVAALVLVIQVVDHYRDQLAASTRFNRPLTALYAALGVHLVPHWDLHAYDVRQLGADVGPSGTITVRASIKNAAQQAQPLPLLRVTLQDRFGNRIASRDVEPRAYLPRSIPAASFLSAGQRIDAQMGFVDPGASAVGFELDACLPAGGGAIACANDTATR